MEKVNYYRTNQIEIINVSDIPFFYKEHNHISVYTIGLVLEGNVTLHYEGRKTTYSPNSYFIIAPYKIHALELSCCYNMLSLCISKKLINEGTPAYVFDITKDIISQIYSQFNYPLLSKAIEEVFTYPPAKQCHNQIMDNANVLWNHPENEYYIQNMADRICFSKYYYIKLFKKSIGMTPHKFQLQNKVRKAQRLIENEMPSAEIAATLGFYDQSHFIKCFKSIIGLTPLEYKKSFHKLP